MEQEANTLSEQEALSALRDHVSKAVDEIVRLRAQNHALARRLSHIEAGAPGAPAINIAGASDPDELRTTISGFIETIDRFLMSDADGNSGEDEE